MADQILVDILLEHGGRLKAMTASPELHRRLKRIDGVGRVPKLSKLVANDPRLSRAGSGPHWEIILNQTTQPQSPPFTTPHNDQQLGIRIVEVASRSPSSTTALASYSQQASHSSDISDGQLASEIVKTASAILVNKPEQTISAASLGADVRRALGNGLVDQVKKRFGGFVKLLARHPGVFLVRSTGNGYPPAHYVSLVEFVGPRATPEQKKDDMQEIHQRFDQALCLNREHSYHHGVITVMWHQGETPVRGQIQMAFPAPQLRLAGGVQHISEHQQAEKLIPFEFNELQLFSRQPTTKSVPPKVRKILVEVIQPVVGQQVRFEVITNGSQLAATNITNPQGLPLLRPHHLQLAENYLKENEDKEALQNRARRKRWSKKTIRRFDNRNAAHGTRPAGFLQQFKVRLAPYYPPQWLEQMLCEDIGGEIEVHVFQNQVRRNLEGLGIKPLTEVRTRDDMCNTLSHLLWVEEAGCRLDLAQYNVDNVLLAPDHTQRSSFQRRLNLHVLRVVGLAEKRPSVLRGDSVKLYQPATNRYFKGYVHFVNLEDLRLSLPQDFQHRYSCDVSFTLNRTMFKTQHRAVQSMAPALAETLLAPA
eukprot:CAMPEP_0194719438 /NCGR_PEP_ID=MMETSP0296-20130528/10890_1 /TAXON_ID=39354 /ORGANISM="Heterosigma akashiwo, Strain CCMP2393" /LENGTH=592 /DNA_ID=CAMNT_0039621175 /DNA_START=49 /DNA_END=1823 /DNA_ORIENTATION=+